MQISSTRSALPSNRRGASHRESVAGCRRPPFLAATPVGCCAFTLFLGESGLVWALVWFAISNTFFQPGLILFDALLPAVSTEENRGWVSGLGIGAGFAGTRSVAVASLVVMTVVAGKILWSVDDVDDVRRLDLASDEGGLVALCSRLAHDLQDCVQVVETY